jgi:hypothetical protein
MNAHYLKNYHDAISRAQYYRWAVSRKFIMPGNDPLTGLHRNSFFQRITRDESVEAYKAMAHYWIKKSREIRVTLKL